MATQLWEPLCDYLAINPEPSLALSVSLSPLHTYTQCYNVSSIFINLDKLRKFLYFIIYIPAEGLEHLLSASLEPGTDILVGGNALAGRMEHLGWDFVSRETLNEFEPKTLRTWIFISGETACAVGMQVGSKASLHGFKG